MKYTDITTTMILDKLDTSEISMKNSNHISWSETQPDGKILLHINNNLTAPITMYHVFLELSYIILKGKTRPVGVDLNFSKFDELDLVALQAYLDHNFDPKLIENTKMFEEKLQAGEFTTLLWSREEKGNNE